MILPVVYAIPIAAAAYGLSSNYNFEPGFGSGFDPIQAAVAKVDVEDSPYSELERDLIHAMATRSSAESKAAIDPAKFMFGELRTCGWWCVLRLGVADELKLLHSVSRRISIS